MGKAIATFIFTAVIGGSLSLVMLPEWGIIGAIAVAAAFIVHSIEKGRS